MGKKASSHAVKFRQMTPFALNYWDSGEKAKDVTWLDAKQIPTPPGFGVNSAFG